MRCGKGLKKISLATPNQTILELIFLKRAYAGAMKSDSILRKAMEKEKYTGNDLDTFTAVEPDAKKAKSLMLPLFQGNDAMEADNQEFLEGFGDYVNGEVKKAEAGTTPPKDYRS